jgi:hypothetical protein
MFGWMTVDILWMHVPSFTPLYFKTVLWENRLLDVILQIVLLFAGVLGVLGLLAEIHETHPSTKTPPEHEPGPVVGGGKNE